MFNKLLGWFWLSHPDNNTANALLTLAVLSTLACILKFLINDASFVVHGVIFNLGKTDSLSYTALLTPTLGAYVTHLYASSTPKDGK